MVNICTNLNKSTKFKCNQVSYLKLSEPGTAEPDPTAGLRFKCQLWQVVVETRASWESNWPSGWTTGFLLLFIFNYYEHPLLLFNIPNIVMWYRQVISIHLCAFSQQCCMISSWQKMERDVVSLFISFISINSYMLKFMKCI